MKNIMKSAACAMILGLCTIGCGSDDEESREEVTPEVKQESELMKVMKGNYWETMRLA